MLKNTQLGSNPSTNKNKKRVKCKKMRFISILEFVILFSVKNLFLGSSITLCKRYSSNVITSEAIIGIPK
ncbi:MAG: hypothetical protein IKW26_00465 [Treponema sp.]|nr:hypothetical protein [Treponema sp.]